jgi:dTDP-4-dehydrorhamnose reductase
MAALSRRHNIVGIDRHPWWGDQPVEVCTGDLASHKFIADTVTRVAPDVLIHCAAMVNVDACERNPALAYACNAGITRDLARAVSPDCLFVYITTDGIFKGDAPFATEELLPCPRTVYGRSKLHGEWEVELATKNHLIVRTNFYGWSSGRKRTAAEWLYHALETGQPITLFDDFFFTPIYMLDFVERLELLIEGGHRGIVHLCGGERVSKYDFGALLAKLAGLSMESVRRGSIEDAGLAAPRPKDMSLSSERFRRLTGVDVPGCMAGLRRFLADRGRTLSARFDAREDDHPTAVQIVKSAHASK